MASRSCLCGKHDEHEKSAPSEFRKIIMKNKFDFWCEIRVGEEPTYLG